MTGLAQLPTEIIVKILRNLEPADLLKLCSMKELSTVIQPLVCVVCGDRESLRRLTEIEDRFFVFNMDKQSVMSHPLVVIDTYDIYSMIDRFLSLTRMSASVFMRVNGERPHNALSKVFERLDGFYCVESAHLTSLFLRKVDLDPDVLRFPSLKQVELDSCHISSKTRSALDFPSLVKLSVKSSFTSIHEHLDYKNTPLIWMNLTSIEDLISWNNVHCPTLQELKIDECARVKGTMASMRNLNLKSLNNLIWRGHYTLRSLENVHFGKIKYLHIGEVFRGVNERCYGDINIKNMDCPSTAILELNFGHLLSLSGIRLPRVDQVIIKCLEGELSNVDVESMDIGFLKRVRNLLLRNASALVPYAPSVTVLDFTGPCPTMPLVLPNLETLCVDDFNDIHNSHLTKLHHITSLRIMKSSKSEDLQRISMWYPNLKKLVVQGAYWGHIENVMMKSIEHLQIFIVGDQSTVSVKKCHFDNLAIFQVTGTRDLRLEEMDFAAPLLNSLVLENISTDGLVIRNFPKIGSIMLKGPIKSIKFEDSASSLRLIQFYMNSTLSSIQSNQNFKKLVKVQGFRVPFSDVIESMAPTKRLFKSRRRKPEIGDDIWEWVL